MTEQARCRQKNEHESIIDRNIPRFPTGRLRINKQIIFNIYTSIAVFPGIFGYDLRRLSQSPLQAG